MSCKELLVNNRRRKNRVYQLEVKTDGKQNCARMVVRNRSSNRIAIINANINSIARAGGTGNFELKIDGVVSAVTKIPNKAKISKNDIIQGSISYISRISSTRNTKISATYKDGSDLKSGKIHLQVFVHQGKLI